MLALQAGDAISEFGLALLHSKHFALEAPEIVAWLKSYALGIHALDFVSLDLRLPLPLSSTSDVLKKERPTFP